MKILLIWVAVSWGLFLYAVGMRGTYLFMNARWGANDTDACIPCLFWPIAWPFILAWVMFEVLAEKYRVSQEPKPIITPPPRHGTGCSTCRKDGYSRCYCR